MTTKKTPRPGVTKADLTDVVYERHGGLTKDEAAEIVDVIFRTVKTSLADGRTVRVAPGFDAATLRQLLAVLEGRPC